MNLVLDSIKRYLAKDETPSIMHYGRSKMDGAPGVGSGRYPLGSGEDPNQHRGDFISRVKELRRQGMSEKDIATAVGCVNTADLRSKYSNAINDQKNTERKSMLAMIADGKSVSEVGRYFGKNESSVRSLLDEKSMQRSSVARETAEFLKKQVDEKGMIDVGRGVEAEIGNGISETRLKQALDILKDEGYEVYGGGIKQVTNPGQQSPQKVLCAPGTQYKDIYDFSKIQTINDYTVKEDMDGNETIKPTFTYPNSMDSSRLMIRYRDDVAPDGHTGIEKDGTIEIRPGCKDLDLGGAHYAQVRILVDGDKYLKGMAFYNDQMPDGVDVIFNTNKARGVDPLKPIGSDPNNPFGALIREKGGQTWYKDNNGNEVLGLVNRTKLEGDWEDWEDKLPSQFLSKQPVELIRKQLNTSIADKEAEFKDIMALTNPTVKSYFLNEFASECDATSVDLHAASLPRQKYQVLMPLSTLKDTEVYAPGYRDGETVALVRFPHGGTFEIPILKVNNNQPEAKRLYGDNPRDLIGINAKVAERLSGADFDGDTAMVIPCNSPTSNVRILSTHPLKGLEGFDPKDRYGTEMRLDANGKETYWRDGHKVNIMSKEYTQKQMGVVSNLITDMTLKGAKEDELARAVAHSMVVIDAAKHKLDWKQSEIDNGINALQREYQRKIDPETGEESYGGASTLLSRAKGEISVLKRQGSPRVNQEGKPWYDPSRPEGAEVYKLADSNKDTLRNYATPKTYGAISPAKQARIDALRASGYTYLQIADMVGVSKSTVTKYLTQTTS